MGRDDRPGHDWICGLDGCRGGWVAARAPAGALHRASVSIVTDIAALLDETPPPLFVAVDMPIGLPERVFGGGRAPERLVRPLLGARQSSVFAIPARAAVEADDYARACAAALATSDPPRKVSKQGFFLFPKIRALDGLLRARPAWRKRVREVHPELAFAALNGGPLDQPKKVKGQPWPAGLAQRRALLARSGLPTALLDAPSPRGAGADDVLDALACLVTAEHMRIGRAVSYPDPPERDAHGLPIAIWAPIPHTDAQP
jgi:predicted RNase H-like nuclease